MISTALQKLLAKHDFLTLSTCSLDNKPNAAPMFLIRVEDDCIYMIDYTMGTTWRNLKVNPRVSISISDFDTLTGFKLNGSVEFLKKGALYDATIDEFARKTIKLSTQRIIDAIHSKKKHKGFEVAIPEKFVVLKVSVEEVVEIGPQGRITKIK